MIIPSNEAILETYNQLFTLYNKLLYTSTVSQEKKITTINYSHPLYDGVFDKRISNFQYPKVERYFPMNQSSGSVILEFEDGKSFLQKNGNAYVFSASIASNNSNFKNSPLIVPTLYNIAKQSLKLPDLYYLIGTTNSYDIDSQIIKDNVLKISKGEINIIPQQQPFSNKTRVTTSEEPSIANIYSIYNGAELVKKVSYNYNRKESDLVYHDINNFYPENTSDSFSEVISNLKSDSKINELWKWFVIFAVLFLIIEMLILKYIK